MRTFTRYLLHLVTGFVPVVIAACYGPAYDFSIRRGKAVDAQTGAGIPDLSVKCMQNGVAARETRTDADGAFHLGYREHDSCELVQVDDVDGAANGRYASTSVPFGDASVTEDLVIPLATQ